jgi:hypothetical protein
MSLTHSLACTDEGQVYMWGVISETYRAPEIPTLFEEAGGLTVRRVSAGGFHSAAITDEGKLYTWLHCQDAFTFSKSGAVGAGYPLTDLEGILYRPRCVEALAGMRIVSVAAGYMCTIVATNAGVARQLA